MEKNLEYDNVKHPEHFNDRSIEMIDIVEDKKQECNLGNTVKYIAKAGKTDPKKAEDLRNTMEYLKRFIKLVE